MSMAHTYYLDRLNVCFFVQHVPVSAYPHLAARGYDWTRQIVRVSGHQRNPNTAWRGPLLVYLDQLVPVPESLLERQRLEGAS